MEIPLFTEVGEKKLRQTAWAGEFRPLHQDEGSALRTDSGGVIAYAIPYVQLYV